MSEKLDIDYFYYLIPNSTRYQIDKEDYFIKAPQFKGEWLKQDKERSHFIYHDQITPDIIPPRLVTWDYLTEDELEKFMKLETKSSIYQFIENKLPPGFPKGFPRIIFRELVYNVKKFCETRKFELRQSGSVLSVFYWTHIYFTSGFNITPIKVYTYFKEMLLCHSVEHPPRGLKLFNLEESHEVMMFFVKIYVRNLPLIRVLCLPSFYLCANYPLEPDPKWPKK